MTAAVDYTGNVLYRYLRALSVKVSRGTVYNLLDIPVGNSMRGISDALDALHIKNEVYQLPISLEYLTQIDTPFITMLQTDKDAYCLEVLRQIHPPTLVPLKEHQLLFFNHE